MFHGTKKLLTSISLMLPWLATHRDVLSPREGSERWVSQMETISGGCFCCAVPAFIHYHRKWRSGILLGSLTSVHCSIWITTSSGSFLDASTLSSWLAIAEFPPPYVLHRPIPVPVWREKAFLQFSHQMMLPSHSRGNHWSVDWLRNDWCWRSGVLVVRLITKLIMKQATKNVSSPPEECLGLIMDVAHTPKSKETFAN